MVVHAYNPSTYQAEAKDCEFEASLGYLARLISKKKERKRVL
jgi:hypothetical protein